MNFQTDALPDRDSTPVTKKSKQSNDKLLTNPNILSSNHKSNHETKLSNTTTNTDTSNAPGSLSRQSSFQVFLSLHSLRSNSCLQSSLHSSGSSIFSPSGDDSGDETGGKKRKRGSSFKGSPTLSIALSNSSYIRRKRR